MYPKISAGISMTHLAESIFRSSTQCNARDDVKEEEDLVYGFINKDYTNILLFSGHEEGKGKL